MSKQNYIIKITRTADGFLGIADGKELDFDKISKIVEAVKDDLEASLIVRNDVIARRQFIAANDLFAGKIGYMGSSKLAKHFNVSGGTISVDRKTIVAKNIQPDPEVVKKLDLLNNPVTEPEAPPEEPATEVEKPVKKSKKNSKNGKTKK